ncbi:MAG: threonine synthase [Dehalococcoidia bacterium]|nr:threonine synthase [Dehalococcoidia bacterium]
MPRLPVSGACGVWRYRRLLPVRDKDDIVSMGEGGTPLVRSLYLGRELGVENLYFKDETRNPTGTFKDRGTTVGVSFAVDKGLKGVGCVSTGNMAMSVAAYAARAGLPALVLVPPDTPTDKMLPLLAYGAKVVVIDCAYPEIFRFGLEVSRRFHYLWLHSDSPLRVEGQKTCAWEIWEQLGRTVPDKVVVPTSSGGNISAIWKGFCELKSMGLTDRLPKMVVVQATGCSPIVRAYVRGAVEVVPFTRVTTVAHSVSNPDPPSGNRALRLLMESGGTAVAVSDRRMLTARAELAIREGILAETASAAGPAALPLLVRSGFVMEHDTVVCVITGTGLKDMGTFNSGGARPLYSNSPDDWLRALEREN